jgi:hypothetical protein
MALELPGIGHRPGPKFIPAYLFGGYICPGWTMEMGAHRRGSRAWRRGFESSPMMAVALSGANSTRRT